MVHIKAAKTASFCRFNLYAMDESRFGLLTQNHKSLTIRGVKPLCHFQHKFEYTYLFGAFSPLNGAHFVLEMPLCNSDTFQLWMDQFALQDSEEYKIILLDNGAFHKAKSLVIPPNMHLMFLPPYSPELNPAEKAWWMIKRALSNTLFKTMEELQQAITKAVNDICTDETIKQLTAYHYYQFNL